MIQTVCMLLLIVVTAILCFAAYFVFWCDTVITVTDINRTPTEFTVDNYSMSDIDFAMKYHGTLHCTIEYGVGVYFYRDGKRINLFTQDVIDALERRKVAAHVCNNQD